MTAADPILKTIDYDTLLCGVRDIGAMQLAAQKSAIESRKIKSDGSDVSKVDIESDRRVREVLNSISTYPIVSEEVSVQDNIAAMQSDQPVWVVDPLDGTRNYLALEPDFSIEIALLSAPDAHGERHPIFGLSYMPTYGKAFYTGQHGTALLGMLNNGEGQELFQHDPKPITATKLHAQSGDKLDHVRVATGSSRSAKNVFRNCAHSMNDFYSPHASMDVASGNADAYACGHEVMIWDMAARAAILEAADARALPVNLEKRQVIAPKFYFGSDPARYYQGKVFTVPPYSSVSNSVVPYLDYAPGVEAPAVTSRSVT